MTKTISRVEVNGLPPKRALPVDAREALVLDVAASRFDRDRTTARLRNLRADLAAS